MRKSTPQDFWARVSIGQENECWEWLGACHSSNIMCGVCKYQGKDWLTHRLAYVLTYGNIIPDHMAIRHTCDNPKCCNVNHMIIDAHYKRSSPKDFWLNVNIGKSNECWEWNASYGTTGYGQVTYQRKVWKTHRLSYFLTYGKIEQCVCHTCDNRKCCNPSHLFLGSRDDNVKDCIQKKRHACGEKVSSTKLTEKQVIEIRRLHSLGKTPVEISTLFGVAQWTVVDVIKKNTWKHIP